MKYSGKAVCLAVIVSIIPTVACANSMPINFIPPELFNWLIRSAGVLGILISAALGFAGLMVARRGKLDTPSKVFAGGFLGVFSVACFAVSAMFLAFSFSDRPWVSSLAITLVFIFFSIEFIIAAHLYLPCHCRFFSPGCPVCFHRMASPAGAGRGKGPPRRLSYCLRPERPRRHLVAVNGHRQSVRGGYFPSKSWLAEFQFDIKE